LRGIVIVERMILKLILKTQEVRYGLDSAGSGGGTAPRCFEHGNEPSGSMKVVEFLDQLSDCHVLNKNCSIELVL
jgi:hypothetical protein